VLAVAVRDALRGAAPAPANSAAVILLRKEFDNLLVERARALGVRFRGGWRAIEAMEENGRVVGVRGLEGRRSARAGRCSPTAPTLSSPRTIGSAGTSTR
jgi:flavin-dependent dehydrogenase